MATDSKTLLAASGTDQGYGSSGFMLDMMIAVLWKKYLLSLNPVATTDAATLLSDTLAKCSACNAGNSYELMLIIIGLLKQIAIAKNPGATVDAKTLLSQAQCDECFTANLYELKLVEVGLIRQLVP